VLVTALPEWLWNADVPRYFIEASAGLAALGLFTSMAHFVVAGRMVVTAVSQAAFPRLADLHAAGDRAAFRWLLIRLVAVSALPGSLGLLVAIAFGRELLSLVYGPRFADGADVFPWIMLVGVVLYAQTPFGYGLTATQRIKVQPLSLALRSWSMPWAACSWFPHTACSVPPRGGHLPVRAVHDLALEVSAAAGQGQCATGRAPSAMTRGFRKRRQPAPALRRFL
jgi:hypothetical protein